MPEALARMRREPTLSVPVREATASRRAKPDAASKFKFRVLPRTFGAWLGLLFGATLIGIVVNAVGLQHERHRAPLFAADPTPAPVAVTQAPPAPVVTPTPETVAAPSAAAPVTPAPSSAPIPVARPATSKRGDAIGDWLRNGGEGAKDIVAAQKALIKLGYDIEADGKLGAGTERALKEFEKAHGLPASTEITPKLLAKMTAAARP